MALALENCCSFYGLATGAAYGATTACIQSRTIASGLLNTWVGLLGVASAAAGMGEASTNLACGTLYVLAPTLGACLGALVSWMTSLNGSE